MKKLLLTACAVMMCIFANAQTIHWLTFIDTTDPNVGRIDGYCRKMLYDYFINEVNAALKGYKTDIQDIYGTRVSPKKCKDVVEKLDITDPNDIIVFYYIGHGVRPATDSDYMRKHPYPQMCLAQNYENEDEFIPLEWVDEQLSTKGARLSVTIGMCCNNVGNVSIKDGPNFSPNYGPTYLSNNKIKRIQELFLNTRGHIIATSSSPGQTSGCVQVNGPQPCHPLLAMQNPQWFRDWFSFAICCFFQTQLDKYDRPLNWDNFLRMISGFVDSNTHGTQTPIYNIYPTKIISKTEQPNTTQTKPSEPIKPQPVTEEQIEVTQKKQVSNKTIQQGDEGSRDWINELTNHLSTLINVSLAESERQALEMSLSKNLFAENAVVKFLAQDSNTNTIIDKADVSDWLGILATNPNGRIIKVIVEEGTFDANKKIKILKVREIYKQQ